MALFSRNKDKKETTTEKVAQKPALAALSTDRNLSGVLLSPRISEKAMRMGEQNVYTFVVHKDATKYTVRDAIKSLFNVTPVKINIVNKSARRYRSRTKGRTVTEKGMKKAYVYLKDGDTINLM